MEKANVEGGSRILFLPNCLKQVSAIHQLNQIMNSEETITLGAGYAGTWKYELFQLK
jgi:hypothetical protein